MNCLSLLGLESYRPTPDLFSYFGGNVELRAKGDIEADFCAVKSGATIQEVNQSAVTTQII